MQAMVLIIKDKLLSKQLDFRVRLFNVLAMVGGIVSIVIAITCMISGDSIRNILANLLGAILAFTLLLYVYHSGRYQLCYIVTIIIMFFIIFPVLFLNSGGYHSGMPTFFVFAIVFTVFMLDGKKMFIIAGLELLLYIGLCVFAYHYPQYITAYPTNKDIMLDVIVGIAVVSISLGTTMYIQLKLYNQQQRLMTEQRDALKRLDVLKTEFLSNVSHELKTPLTVMSGYAQSSGMQLADQQEHEAIINKMKIIASEADRLALMVGQILDVTRIEEGRMTFDIVPCRIEEIIHTAVETHFPILNKNNNRLVFALDEPLSKVMGDPMRLTQVVVNLISNAIRFTTNGVITVSARQGGHLVEVAVADTGSGIAPERLLTIFERFNHVKKPGSGSDTGTGLGLYLCKNTVEAHGGAITVQSELDKGTKVLFTVPLA